MCGIFGYVGPKNAVEVALKGLKKLEYRGYDSAGIAGLKNGELLFVKEVGKISVLEKRIQSQNLQLDTAISQTRWATHGKPSAINAHPHLDSKESIAVVHNGIIENYQSLRHMLKDKGIAFSSETDTEVIAHLISDFYEGDFLKAVQQTIPLLKGSFSLAIVHKDFPHEIIAVAYHSPLAIGIAENETFISSDPNAFDSEVKEVIFMGDGEIAVIQANNYSLFDSTMAPINKQTMSLVNYAEQMSKGDYAHYTLKEINEQPQTLRSGLLARGLDDYGTAMLDDLNFEAAELLGVERVLFLACGTSWHAGYLSSYMMEDKARIPAQVEISSEFRYKNPVIPKGTLVIAISQSGETADTLAAVRELKAKGVKVLAVCNVPGSSLAREANGCLFLRAGPEIGVCSTKAFTSQVTVLGLFTLLMARMRHMSKVEGQEFLHALKKLPAQAQMVLDQSSVIQEIAKKYAHYENFFFIGRRYMYPTALEGALKLKEISYINANGYPAGEMKHGPIALINEECPTVALCANKLTFEKMISNIMEVKARNGAVIAIAEEGTIGLEGIADDIIWVPETIDELATVPTSIVLQLLAYYISIERGTDIDQPRNLAKSVTVE